MTNYSKMAMGPELASLNHISIEKKLFGLIINAIYLPTKSKIDGYKLYLSQKGAKTMDLLMKTEKEGDIDSIVESGNKIEYDANGNEKIDVCVSKDHHFLALQRFCYKDYCYAKASDVRIFEDEAAKKVSSILGI